MRDIDLDHIPKWLIRSHIYLDLCDFSMFRSFIDEISFLQVLSLDRGLVHSVPNLLHALPTICGARSRKPCLNVTYSGT